MSDDSSRMEALEIKIAHLEKNLLELGDVVFRQQQQIETTLALCRGLAQQLSGVGERAAAPDPGRAPQE